MDKDKAYKLIEEHYRKNNVALQQRILRYVKSPHRAEDVVQEAYMRAFTYAESCPDTPTIDAWFNTIVNNCVKDNHREENQQGMVNYEELPELSVRPSAIPKILRDQVEARIKQEPENIRAILDLALLKQYRIKEIEQMVPETAGAIKQIVYRFRQAIKKEYSWSI